MKKTSSKKKTKRAPKATRTSKSAKPKVTNLIQCAYCEKKLTPSDSALFVEEEVGRVFCTEACISHFFSPDVERLEEEYY